MPSCLCSQAFGKPRRVVEVCNALVRRVNAPLVAAAPGGRGRVVPPSARRSRQLTAWLAAHRLTNEDRRQIAEQIAAWAEPPHLAARLSDPDQPILRAPSLAEVSESTSCSIISRIETPSSHETTMRFFTTEGPVNCTDHDCLPPLKTISVAGLAAQRGEDHGLGVGSMTFAVPVVSPSDLMMPDDLTSVINVIRALHAHLRPQMWPHLWEAEAGASVKSK